MGMTATLDGRRVLRARVTLTKWGCSYADVSLDGEHTLAGKVDLVLADLTMKCGVIAGGPEKGKSAYRLVAGAAGWGKILPAFSYDNEAGVKASIVVGDAARLAGEELDAATVPTTMRVGPAYVRPEGPASDVLERVAPAGWYVGEDGITRIGARPTAELKTKVTIVEVDRGRGKALVASETLAPLVPGVVVAGLEAVDVEHTVSAEKGVRSVIWGKRGAGGSRGLTALRALVDHLVTASLRECRKFEYVVVTRNGKRLNLKPVRSSTGMPPLKNVRMWPGVAGCYAELELGSRVLVEFLDNGEPAVTGFEDADGEGFVPSKLVLADGTDLQSVARKGDQVACPAGTGLITGGSSTVRCG